MGSGKSFLKVLLFIGTADASITLGHVHQTGSLDGVATMAALAKGGEINFGQGDLKIGQLSFSGAQTCFCHSTAINGIHTADPPNSIIR